MKETPFSTILEALKNSERPFPARYYVRFSDLSAGDLAAFVKIWPAVPLERKRTFLKALNDAFDDDTLLLFDSVAIKLIHDPDNHVRTLALRLLDETEDERLIPELLKLAQNDPEIEARAQAARDLGQFVRLGEMNELNEHKLKQVEYVLLKIAQDPNPDLARAGLEAMGYSSRPEMEALISAAFNRADPLWKAAALFAAGRSADQRWQEIVIVGLINEDTIVRLNAARSAGELDLKLARKPLLEMLEDEGDDDVFQTILWSLSQIGGEDVRTYIEALLADAEDDEQIEFLEDALANLSFTEDMESFDLLAVDPDDDLEEDDNEEE